MFDGRSTRIAITGATGFVGGHAALEIRRSGADVVAIVRASSDVRHLQAAGVRCVVASLDDPRSLDDALAGCAGVVHCAGAVGFDGDWATYTRVNVAGTRHLLAAARRAGVARFLHVSSIVAVGGSREHRVLDEGAAWNLGPLQVPYVTTKRWAEEAALQANGAGWTCWPSILPA